MDAFSIFEVHAGKASQPAKAAAVAFWQLVTARGGDELRSIRRLIGHFDMQKWSTKMRSKVSS